MLRRGCGLRVVGPVGLKDVMISLDGSEGEGGGQILRSALGLSMVTGRPFRIEKIRAKREKPGLMRQHLACVNAATAICGAKVLGAHIGSTTLSFSPGPVVAGDHRFAVGSAGSTMLVLQTVLPALLTAGASSTVLLEGGTHNPYAPPTDFVERAFLPVLRRMGAVVGLTVERAGFYPAGGGRVSVAIAPAERLAPISLLERGQQIGGEARALVAALPGEIAKRELERVGLLLGWPEERRVIRQLPEEWGPGNVLMLFSEWEHITEVFTGVGMKGVSAEAVGENTCRLYREYLAANVPVGSFLADQLLIPLALAGGGGFRTTEPSSHTVTNAKVVEAFVPVSVRMSKEPSSWLVEVVKR